MRYLCVIVSFLVSVTCASVYGLARDYKDESSLCSHHLKPYVSMYAKELTNCFDSIPRAGNCQKISCTTCGDNWNSNHEVWTTLGSNPPKKYQKCHEVLSQRCKASGVYRGYFERDNGKYFRLFQDQIEYQQLCKNCLCFWPETSKIAAEINDTAYELFEALFEETALIELLQTKPVQYQFFSLHFLTKGLNAHDAIVACICHCFRFSHYYHVLKDIESYAQSRYSVPEAAKIKDFINEILDIFSGKFLPLYTSCLTSHFNLEIEQEVCFIRLRENDISGLVQPYISKSVSKKKSKSQSKKKGSKNLIEVPEILVGKGYSYSGVFSPQSDLFLEQGTVLNNYLLYKDAIEALTQAIKHDRYNRDAYIERALAYFETDQITLALKDYKEANALTTTFPYIYKSPSDDSDYIPDSPLAFSRGLIVGTLEGGKESAIEFLPSMFGCARGIFDGLWACACSPAEVSREMIDTAYSIGTFIYNHSTQEYLACVVPEIEELYSSWEYLDDYCRGKRIGHIIGKYGVDVFIPIGVTNGIVKLRALKRANTMCTLEVCSLSEAKKAKILAESSQRAAKRETLLKAQKGKILIKSPNVSHHVMQEKHAWEKLIKLTGDVEVDFGRVLALLEEAGILSEQHLLKAEKFGNGKILRMDYKICIKGREVQAVFETYIESSHIFLKDAWIITQ